MVLNKNWLLPLPKVKKNSSENTSDTCKISIARIGPGFWQKVMPFRNGMIRFQRTFLGLHFIKARDYSSQWQLQIIPIQKRKWKKIGQVIIFLKKHLRSLIWGFSWKFEKFMTIHSSWWWQSWGHRKVISPAGRKKISYRRDEYAKKPKKVRK